MKKRQKSCLLLNKKTTNSLEVYPKRKFQKLDYQLLNDKGNQQTEEEELRTKRTEANSRERKRTEVNNFKKICS